MSLLTIGRTRIARCLTWVWLLRPGMRRPVLPVVALVLMTVTTRSLLSVWHLLSVGHTSVLHAHGVSLRAWGSIALPRIGAPLLGPGSSGRPLLLLRLLRLLLLLLWLLLLRLLLLLLLRVRVGPSVRLVPHLPYLLHGA